MNKYFWKNKRVLITGHTGFKGSWLSFWLKQKKAYICGISLKEKKFSFFSIIGSKNIVDKNIYCNINNFNNFKKEILKFNPNIIFHLAAQPLVIESYFNPIKTIKTNILGTANLLEISKKCKSLKSIVIVTSDKCYDPSIKKKFIENDKLGGNDIYSASKAGTEIITNAFRETFFKNKKLKIKISTVRAGNVVGGGDFAKNRIFPDLIKSYYSKKKCLIRNKNFVRPWQHVLDPLSGYITLAEKMYNSKEIKFESAWNFGPKGNSKKVIDIVKQVKKYIKVDINFSENKKKIIETKNLQLESLKARHILNWKNKISFNKMINLSLIWYLNFRNKKKIIEISKKQIEDYENME